MPKANAIGTPMPTQAATITTKNTIRLPKPICEQHRLSHPEQRRDAADGEQRQTEAANGRRFEQAQQRDHGSQPGADQQRDDAVAVGNLQRYQLNKTLLVKIFRGGQQDLQHEGDHH